MAVLFATKRTTSVDIPIQQRRSRSWSTTARLAGNKLKQTSKMTAFSIFNDCTIEDMNQHLFALAAGSRHALLPRVEVTPSRVRIKITVDEVRAPGQTIQTSVRDCWLPGEQITGTLSIESKDPITLAHARIRLDGKTTLTLGSQLLSFAASSKWLTNQ